MKFNRLSPTTDFISKLQSDLDILNKNLLYITHVQDNILKIVKDLQNMKTMQNTIDEFYGTSPQTESNILEEEHD